jgi:2,3-bisphosphoglycerate-dependent phosphoglycerate mutase
MDQTDRFRKIYILTHCETCFNSRGIFTGRLDSVLTARGHEHADYMAKLLKDVTIGIAYRSSLIRTKETLDHILKDHPETHVIVDDRIIERDYGELSGKSKKKYEAEHPDLYPVYHRSYLVAPPGGESMKDVEKRVLPFIEDVIALVKRKKINVLIVAHGNSVRPLVRYFQHLTPEEMMRLENIRHKLFEYQIEVN